MELINKMKIKEILQLDIELLVSLMRSSGIKSLSCGESSIVLDSPAPIAGTVEPSNFEDEAPKEKLACGHFFYESNELGECFHGCDSTKKEE